MSVTFKTPDTTGDNELDEMNVKYDGTTVDCSHEPENIKTNPSQYDKPFDKTRQTKVISTINNNNHLIDRMVIGKMETSCEMTEEMAFSNVPVKYAVIDNCSHGTQSLENRLKLKGEPIGHSESVAGVSRSLIIQIVMTVIFCMLEFITGVVCSSIAMLADSYHMAADVMALIVAFTCIKIATRPSTRHGYGWVRAETLGGFFNGIFMITVCILVFQEAVGRVIHVHMIEHPLQVLVIGGIGLLINLFGMFNLNGHGHSHGGGGHGHSHGSAGHSHSPNSKKKIGHGHSHNSEGHGHGHGHSHNHDDDENHCDEQSEAPVGSSIRKSLETRKSDAVTRLLESEESNETIERRLSGAANQNVIIATVERSMTPYATHMASEVLNSSTSLSNVDAESKQKKDKNVNIHGVWLHLLSDAFGSIIVMISAGFVFFWPELKIAAYLDPILSMCLATIMGFTAVVLVKTSGEKLLKQTPKELDLEKVKQDLCSIVGVSKVEKLSVWTLCGQRIIAAAHINFCHPAVFAEAAFKVKKYFHDMGVHSTTIEPTFEDTCMKSMTVMVKKLVNGKSVEEPMNVSTEDEVTNISYCT